MTKEELSLLLFLETVAVDGSGRIDVRKMNADDFEIAKRWAREGFIRFGRVCHRDLKPNLSAWVELTDASWAAAHAERRARAARTFAKRTWQTTEEYRDEVPDAAP